MLFIYSGGLHHVLAPGDRILKVFKKIHVALEKVSIAEYMKKFEENGQLNKEKIIQDLEERRDRLCPRKPRPKAN